MKATEIEFYKPQNEILQKYIEGYYFISSSATSEPLRYSTFPNNFFIISVTSNAELRLSDNKILVTGTQKENIIANYVARYVEPIEVFCEGDFNEVTIYFKPLGIQHFMAEAEKLLVQNSASDFNPYADFMAKMKSILNLENRSTQCDQLESYYLSKLRQVDLSFLEKLVADVEMDLKIDEIAKKHHISRQYLNKLFKQAVGKSPVEFRKVQRFRNAIAKQKYMDSLTKLSYESMFYDQSHLIKDFKQLAKISPNSFFKKVDTEKEYIWLYI